MGSVASSVEHMQVEYGQNEQTKGLLDGQHPSDQFTGPATSDGQRESSLGSGGGAGNLNLTTSNISQSSKYYTSIQLWLRNLISYVLNQIWEEA